MKNDLISVIVPIYRVEKYLEQCIQSIRNQTYRNLEIILVDDGSDDNCPSICDRYAEEDKRIKVIHKENGGLDSARKAGIQNATGKYVGYVDGDDWIEPDMYEKMMAYASQYDVAAVEIGIIDSWLDREQFRVPNLEEGCYKGERFVEKIESRILYTGNFYQYGVEPYLWSVLVLREKLMKYQMMENLTNLIHDDTMVILPCIAESKSLYITHECLYHYRVRYGSLKRSRRADEKGDLIKCYPDFYKRFQGTLLCSEQDKQIKYYTLYWLLYKAPDAFDDVESEEFLLPYGGIRKESKIVLYGAGAAGIHLEHYIRNTKGSHMICWVDKNYQDMSRVCNVQNPADVKYMEFDYVIISILRHDAVKNVKKNLAELGIPNEKIRWIDQQYIDQPELLLDRILE